MKETEKPVCNACGGTGKCSKCDGSGHVIQNLPTPISVVSGTIRRETPTGTRRPCPRCTGTGTCQTCHGTGKSS